MTRRLIDISIPLEMGTPSDPPGMQVRIDYTAHGDSVPQMAASFPGLTAADMPDGQGWAVETVTISTHNGTHMDAPWHFHPTQDSALPGGARRADSIDKAPLDWCYRPGVKLDFRHVADGHVVTAAEVEAELVRIGHRLSALDIVLVNTRAGALYGEDGYLHAGCGMGREATLYLTRLGVRVVGTDAWSWDAPFSHTAKRWAKDRDPSIIWEGHKAGREIGYYQMEKLHNLEALPAHGFEVICFPVKVKNGSAGWTRAVALLED